MNKPDESKWIRLILLNDVEIQYFNYIDGRGNRLEYPFESSEIIEMHSTSLFIAPMRYSKQMDEHIKAIASAEPVEHYTGEGDKRIPIAVYLELSPELLHPYELSSIEKIVYDYLIKVLDNPASFQIVFYEYEPRSITPFRLPFNIRFVGEEATEMMSVLQNANFYKNNVQVERFGLSLKVYPDSTEIILENDIDILVFSSQDFEEFMDPKFQLDGSIPRLYIVLCPFPLDYLDSVLRYNENVRDISPNLGYTSLYLNSSNKEDEISFFEEFIYCLIHDFPLHEALNYALSKANGSKVSAKLLASPSSNHNLRMSDALESLKTEIHEYSKTMNPGILGDFLMKFSKDDSHITDEIKTIIPNDPYVHHYYNYVRSYDLNFYGESTGLVPMSIACEEFQAMKSQFKQFRSGMKSMVNQKEIFNAISSKQERKVDITLEQVSSSLVYTLIDKHFNLKSGGQYRLNVSIGQSSPFSLIEGQVPSIDPLLPDPENVKGHELDIVVFAKDFELISPSHQSVYLPLLGGTDIIRFIIKAPTDMNFASLRVGIFYKNNLLQAFVLTAQVKDQMDWIEDGAIKVTFDLSTSKKFTNLNNLKPRDLYVGVNENGNGTHSLFIKKDEVATEISGLNETVIKDAQKKLNELLNKAYFKNGDPKYLANTKPGDKISEDFYSVVREFAIFGRTCHSHIFQSNDVELRTKLKEISKSGDMDITIGRHQLNFSYPWPLLYDYILETPRTGMPDHPVCMGEKLEIDKYPFSVDEKGEGCPHNPGLHTYCIDGFWGIRHRIEQVLSSKAPEDAKINISLNGSSNISYCNNVEDTYSSELEKTLQTKFNAKKITLESDFLQELWDVSSRPATFVVFGHMQTDPVSGEPNHPRIITFPKEDWPKTSPIIPKEKWIYHELLDNNILIRDSWEGTPLPIVFLINCSNAGMNVDSLNSIVKDFHTAGATAVIGTECNITSDLGARFITEVLDGVYNKELELGQAIQLFNKNLFLSGIPLAFVFTCFGNNNLKLTK